MPEGILCVDKPADFTSFDVVAKVRGMSKCRKIGHGGTLDPMATGVLPLFFGRAVKATALMPVQDKRYTARVRLGLTTDTQDITGTVLSETRARIDRERLEEALCPLRGTIRQLPPMYSAVWVDGRRLYDLAREGREIDRPEREVTIHSLELLGFDEAVQEFELDVRCSKGTFIRTLCHDLGQALGCGAVLTELRRTETLGYTIDQCVTLDTLQRVCDEGELDRLLLPTDSAFSMYGRIFLSPQQANMFRHGIRLDSRRIRHPDTDAPLRIYGGGRFLGLARIDRESFELVLIKLFAVPDEAETGGRRTR